MKFLSMEKKLIYYHMHVLDDEGVKHKIKLHEDVIIANKMIFKSNQEIDYSITQLKELEDYTKLYQKVIYYCSYMPRTLSQTKKYLKKHCDSDELIQSLLVKVIDLGFINDQRYVENYISDAIRLKHLGSKKIYQKLYEKGVDKELIKAQLTEKYSEDLIFKNIEYWILNRKNRTAMSRVKLENFIIGKGFGYEVVKSMVGKVDFDESKPLVDVDKLRRDVVRVKERYEQKEDKYKLRQRLFGRLYRKGIEVDLINELLDEILIK